MGGLSGKATIIQQQREASASSLLLLDAGKSFFKKNNHTQPQLTTALGIANAYISMGYDAVAVSANDMKGDGLFFAQTLQDGLPWLSANLVDNTGATVAPTHLIKTVSSLKIALIGLTDTISKKNKYSTINYKSALTPLLREIDSQCDIIILLSNLSGDVNKQIGRQFPAINLIISSDKTLGKMAPMVINRTLITQTSRRGKYLGKLEIDWEGSNVWYNKRLRPLAELRKKDAAIGLQLARLSEREHKQRSNLQKRISQLRLQKQRLLKEINSRQIQEAEQAGRPLNQHRLTFIPVLPKNSPREIEAIVEEITNQLRR
ncbi:MAG: hypothetical protein COA36_06900 [Desulfotalea sp.]|nr:MAG: hypothetical protein COA36_06900 [Desulfotalea sp.]